MRKILITILTIGAIFSFSLKINATISTYITAYDMEEELGDITRLTFTITLDPSTSNVSLLLPYRSTNTIERSGVRSYVQIQFTDNSYETLDWGDTWGNYFDWGNQPSCPNCPLLVLDLEYFEDKQPKQIYISITQTFNHSAIPPGFIEQYINEVQVYVDVYNNRVVYYSQGEVYLTTIFGVIPLQPTAPIPPSGYEFRGWVRSNGSQYTFTEVTEDMLVNGSFYLYALFTPTTNDPVIEEPPTNVPQSLRDILSIVRLDNVSGYGIFYALIAVALILISVIWLKVNGLILAIVQLLWLGLALYIGLVNIWISVVVVLMIILIILYRLKVE